jgi:hypothetical protein
MRDTEIKGVWAYLGPFPSVLKMGDIQKMNFQEGEYGPFWLSPEEKEKSKRDQPSGKIKKHEYNIKELIQKLFGSRVCCKWKEEAIAAGSPSSRDTNF